MSTSLTRRSLFGGGAAVAAATLLTWEQEAPSAASGPVGGAAPAVGGAMSASVLHGYGSSLMESGEGYLGQGRIAGRWLSLLAQSFGAQERNYGRGGTTLIQGSANHGWPLAVGHAWRDLSPVCAPYKLRPWRQLALLKHGYNEAKLRGDDPAFLATFEHGVRAWIALQRSHFAQPESHPSLQFTGFGPSVASTNFGGSYRRCSGHGRVVWGGDSGFTGGDVYLHATVTAAEHWSCAVTLDGKEAGGLDASQLGVGNWFTHVAIPARGVSPGQRVGFEINGTARVMGTSVVYPDRQPLVLLMGSPVTVKPRGAWTPERARQVNEVLSGIAEPDDGVRFVDLSFMDGDPQYFYGDGVHYSLIGNGVVYEATRATIDAAGGVPQAHPPRADRVTAGVPDWSGLPGEEAFDPEAGKFYYATGGQGRTWTVR